MHKVPAPAAAVDLGSNSFRLLIGYRSGQELVTLAKERAPIRLAHGLGKTGNFANDKLATALAAIASFRRELEFFSIGRVRCCGTESLRQAANRHSLIEPAEKILGTPIEILTGREEAELSSLGVQGAVADKLSYPCLIADVGGGSCELILLHSPGTPAKAISLPIGAVILGELDTAARKLALRVFSRQIKKFSQETGQGRVKTMVGTGGTASSLAMLAQQMPVYNSARINGFVLSGSQITEIYSLLSVMPLEQRKGRPGMEAGREEIIISGMEIYQEILATIGAPGMIVSDSGLLEGILYSITGGLLA